MNLLPEYLVSTAGVPNGEIVLVTDQTVPAPLRAAGGGVAATQSTPDSAASGIANLFSFSQAIPFSLADLQNAGGFSSQYDYYRINSITCTVTYKSNATEFGQINPTMYCYVDVDDVVLPTSQHDVIARQGVKRWEFNNKGNTKYSVTFKPKFKVTTGLIGGTVATTKPSSGWIDCAYPAVQHFGLKLWCENIALIGGTGPVPNTCLQYEFKYNLSFKGPINQY